MSNVNILSGKDTAKSIYNNLKLRILSLKEQGVVPGLCVVLVGEHPASKIYVRTKTKKLKSLGLISNTIQLPENIEQKKLIKVIDDLNNDINYHGILVQLPLP